MPIDFRCTRCRARLHVPTRWGGTTVPCPKCETRVVVPKTADRRQPTSLESRAAEASIAALASGQRAGGAFAADDFAIPDPSEPASEEAPVIATTTGLTLAGWRVYALIAAAVGLLLASFLLGVWYGTERRDTIDRPPETHDEPKLPVLLVVPPGLSGVVGDPGPSPVARRIERFSPVRC